MERAPMKVSKPVDEAELSNFKRNEQITLIFWICFGIAALVVAVLYFAFIGLPNYLTVTIGEWKNVTNPSWTLPEGYDWDGTVAGTYTFSMLDIVKGGWSVPATYLNTTATGVVQTVNISYVLGQTQMVYTAFWLQAVSVGIFVLALIGGAVAYFTKKKLSALPVGLALLSMMISMLGLGYLLLGSTSIICRPSNPVIPDVTYGGIYWILIAVLCVFYVLGVTFVAISPYVIDHRASALYDLGLKH